MDTSLLLKGCGHFSTDFHWNVRKNIQFKINIFSNLAYTEVQVLTPANTTLGTLNCKTINIAPREELQTICTQLNIVKSQENYHEATSIGTPF